MGRDKLLITFEGKYMFGLFQSNTLLQRQIALRAMADSQNELSRLLEENGLSLSQQQLLHSGLEVAARIVNLRQHIRELAQSLNITEDADAWEALRNIQSVDDYISRPSTCSTEDNETFSECGDDRFGPFTPKRCKMS